MYFKTLIIFILSLLIDTAVTAQNNEHKIDEINKKIKSISELVTLSPDSALIKANECLSVSTEIKYQKGIAKSKYLIGLIYIELENYSKAELFLLSASQIFIEIKENEPEIDCYLKLSSLYIVTSDYGKAVIFANKVKNNNFSDKSQLSKAYSILSAAYRYFGNYPEALKFIEISMKLCESVNDTLMIAENCNNLAIIYAMNNNNEKSLEYYKKSLSLYFKINNKLAIAKILNNIGVNYTDQNQEDSAFFYFDKSYNYSISINNSYCLALSSLNLGQYYMRMKKYEESEKYIITSIEYCKKINNNSLLSASYLVYSEMFDEKNEINKSIENCEKALNYAQISNSATETSDAYLYLAKYYARNKDFKNAFENINFHITLYDSIFNIDKTKVIENITTVYETEKKEQQIKLMSANENIKNIELSKKQTTIVILLGSLFLTIFFIGILTIVVKKLQSAYKNLVRKNLEILKSENIEEKHLIRNGAIADFTEKENQILSELEILIIEKVIFFDETLSLEELAKKLNTNRSVLSKIINTKYNTNFNNFINELRVKEACKLIELKKHETITLEAIAKQVGFHSRVTFTNSFKKVTGVPPSFYAKSLNDLSKL